MPLIFKDPFFKKDKKQILPNRIINESLGFRFGDILIYNPEDSKFRVLSNIQHVNNESIIGIVVKDLLDVNETDIVLKNYLTTNGVAVPVEYKGKEKYIPAYLKDMFNRYLSKYVRTSEIDISQFKMTIPSIQQLDYLYENIAKFQTALTDIWGEKRAQSFLERMYEHGILATHKNKYYQWLPALGKKRVINNLESNMCYELLPVFRYRFDI